MKKSFIIATLLFMCINGFVMAQTDALTILPNGNVGIGTTTPTQKLDVNGNVQVTGDINTQGKVQENNHDLIPRGTIIMWHGEHTKIPDGWAVCDGDNGTPDLRDRFIIGAGKNYKVDSTGGKDSVSLKINEMPRHTHTASSTIPKEDGKHLHYWNGYYQKEHKDKGSQVRSRNKISSDSKDAINNNDGIHGHDIETEIGFSGDGATHENRPPFYALLFLMKL